MPVWPVAPSGKEECREGGGKDVVNEEAHKWTNNILK